MKKKCNVLQADFSITGIRPQNIYIYSRLKSTYVLDKEVRQSTLVSLSLRSSCYPVAASFFCVSEGLLTLYSRKSETGNIRMTIPVFLLVATATTSVFVVVKKREPFLPVYLFFPNALPMTGCKLTPEKKKTEADGRRGKIQWTRALPGCVSQGSIRSDRHRICTLYLCGWIAKPD